MEIYNENAKLLNTPGTTSMKHRALTVTVRTPQCGHTAWGTKEEEEEDDSRDCGCGGGGHGDGDGDGDGTGDCTTPATATATTAVAVDNKDDRDYY